jgi:hypothetical protein
MKVLIENLIIDIIINMYINLHEFIYSYKVNKAENNETFKQLV